MNSPDKWYFGRATTVAGGNRRYGRYYPLSWTSPTTGLCVRCGKETEQHHTIGFDEDFLVIARALRTAILKKREESVVKQGKEQKKARSKHPPALPLPNKGMMALARIRGQYWFSYSGTPSDHEFFSKQRGFQWSVNDRPHECKVVVAPKQRCAVDISGMQLSFTPNKEGPVHIERKETNKGFKDCDATPPPLECAGARVLSGAFADAKPLGSFDPGDRLVELWLGVQDTSGSGSYKAYTEQPAPPCCTCRQVLPALLCKFPPTTPTSLIFRETKNG